MSTIERKMASVLSRNWWVLLLRGLIAILFGIFIWIQPEISLITLVLFFGVYALADGILCIWTAITGRKEHEHWWLLLLWGLAGAGIGVLTFFVPDITALALLFYIAIWAVATGILEIVSGIQLRKEVKGEWLLIISGLASILFGVILMVQPIAGALVLLWLIGSYAIIFGGLLVILAFKIRAVAK